MYTCVCITCVSSPSGGQKGVSDTLKAEFGMVASYHVKGWELNLSRVEE